MVLPEQFALLTLPIGLYGAYGYIKSTIRGDTKPNRVSWILWTIAPFIGVFMMHRGGAGLSVFTTFMAGFTPLLVVIASFWNKKSYWKITPFDLLCGLFSLAAITYWVLAKDPIISLYFAIVADLFAGAPTIVKSWKYPNTENITPYVCGLFNSVIAFLTMRDATFASYGFPLYLFLINVVIIYSVKRKRNI